MHNILLPELGEGIEKATVACWHAACGDKVEADDDIVEMVTDKATFNVPTGSKGVVKEIHAQIGEEVKIGSVLAVIEN